MDFPMDGEGKACGSEALAKAGLLRPHCSFLGIGASRVLGKRLRPL